MEIGILRENAPENRVAFTPEIVKDFSKLGIENISIEQGAGTAAHLTDEMFKDVGLQIKDRSSILQNSDVLLMIHPLNESELKSLKKGAIILGHFAPLSNKALVEQYQQMGITSFSLDIIPRTTRAQSMDILSSMATAAGYKAVLRAASDLPQFFPMFMTAAGTIKPAKVLILGAGVAGLQAIATAKRLGAVVEAFDVRTAAKEEVLSLGAKFVEVEGAQEDAAAGGYAIEQTEAYKQKQAQLIHDHAVASDVVITTAQIPGRRAPLLIKENTIEQMKSGSVLVDLAASTGGNCAFTKNNETVIHNGVSIIGDSNLASSIPMDASRMFAKNISNFLKLIVKEGQLHLNFEDDLVTGTCITHEGNVKSERVQKFLTKA